MLGVLAVSSVTYVIDRCFEVAFLCIVSSSLRVRMVLPKEDGKNFLL